MTPSMPGNDPLAALKDIHLPPPVGFWPPAPGWYVLVLLALVLAGLLAWGLFRLRRRRQWRQRVRATLPALPSAESNTGRFFTELNGALKRYARERYPEANPAVLSGAGWSRFLADKAPSLPGTELEKLAASGIEPRPKLTPREARELAQQWLRSQGC
ncbi:DUF4381 domain-containing protein [Marinobacteraceae bacterium S3BR75-40.1]